MEVVDIGPIAQWTNLTGMDGSQEQIMLNTRCKGRDVEYNLVRPSAEYLVLYENTYRMVYMCNKIIIQLCQYNRDDRLMEYSELLEFIDTKLWGELMMSFFSFTQTSLSIK